MSRWFDLPEELLHLNEATRQPDFSDSKASYSSLHGVTVPLFQSELDFGQNRRHFFRRLFIGKQSEKSENKQMRNIRMTSCRQRHAQEKQATPCPVTFFFVQGRPQSPRRPFVHGVPPHKYHGSTADWSLRPLIERLHKNDTLPHSPSPFLLSCG